MSFRRAGEVHSSNKLRAFLHLAVLGVAAGMLVTALTAPHVRAAGKTDALLLSCMDYRLVDDVERYMGGRKLRGKDDHIVLAGASLGAVTDKFPSWNKTFWDHVGIAIKLHHIHKVIVLDHRDRGAYKEILGEDLAKDAAKETRVHTTRLRELAGQIRRKYPKIEVELLLMALDGKVETITPSNAHAPGTAKVAAPAANRLITAQSVGPARLGTTVAAARKALKGFTLERSSDGDGVALIGVLKGKKPVMTLYAGEDDRGAPINEKAVVQLIEVTDAGYATGAGVRPGMHLKEVERRYGRLKRIFKSEIEAREYAEFSKSPAGLTFRVLAKDGDAGRYEGEGASVASSYTPSAYVYSISISKPG